ncbi:unnamed protein product [Psylliodes chrysocephalus]|uniref:Carbonic anhydrase n=1 Tax=Psylliodes chrysocephalus TaxID=3402493 RepID=A0A9P0GC01_9CUCU|nr:unnamed protein product [Psylliodes chrysocephala]
MTLDWGYGPKNGPQTWVSHFPDAAGQRQSPIDIKPVDVKVLNSNAKLHWKYEPETLTEISNTGAAWRVDVKGKGSELRGGPLLDEYVLNQFHCHWGESNDRGSEHTINGQYFAGELHLVHWNSAKYSSIQEAANNPDGLCVLGVFLKPGKKHEELDKVVKQLNKVQYKNQCCRILESIDPTNFLPLNSGYYTYHGSLTTPPCSECVVWIVFKEPVEVSIEQLEAFRNLKSLCKEEKCYDEYDGFVKRNFRPTLPVGQREVKECRQ